MDYKGVIIQESLTDTSVLTEVKKLEIKVEPITKKHKTPWLKQWTLHTVKIPEDRGDEIAEKLSKSLEQEHHSWYADYENDDYHFIVFPKKVFKVDLKNPVLYKEAKKYGVALGIPKYQVDFAPKDKVWKR